MNALKIFFAAVVLASIAQPAEALPERVIVRLFEIHPPAPYMVLSGPVQILSPGSGTLGGGTYRVERRKGGIVFVGGSAARRIDGRSVIVRAGDRRPIRVGYPKIDKDGGDLFRTYNGEIKMIFSGGGISAINSVSSHDYVSSVVGSETMAGCPEEALKAQAVLVMTRLARLKTRETIGDSTQDEAYLGAQYETEPVTDAVKSVWGKILTFEKRPIQPFFHSTCAGRTSRGYDVFGQPASSLVYLESVECGYCKNSPFWKSTTSEIPGEAFRKKFADPFPEITARDKAGRPVAVRFGGGGAGGARTIPGYQFWIQLGQTFGWGKAPGTMFSLKKLADGNVEIESRGAGHGVGMCQWGAYGQAKAGRSYDKILQYYFPGTKVENQ